MGKKEKKNEKKHVSCIRNGIGNIDSILVLQYDLFTKTSHT